MYGASHFLHDLCRSPDIVTILISIHQDSIHENRLWGKLLTSRLKSSLSLSLYLSLFVTNYVTLCLLGKYFTCNLLFLKVESIFTTPPHFIRDQLGTLHLLG